MVALSTATQFYGANQRIESAVADMETSFDVGNNYSYWLPVKNRHTEINEVGQHSRVITSDFKEISQEKTTEAPQPKKNQADGTVLEIDEATVKCEVYSHHQNRVINLSKALFEDNIQIGMPFTLFLDDTSGYKRLLVKNRAVNEDFRQHGNDEMAALVNEL